MIKKTAFFLWTGWLGCQLALAHPLSEHSQAVAEQAQRLHQQMLASTTSLTWGQKMAADDMARLVEAAQATAAFLQPDEVDWEAGRGLLNELQVSGNRVRMTLSVANLDEEGQQLAQELVRQVEEIDGQARDERGRRFERAAGVGQPRFGLGLGVGIGPAWGWGQPWGWGRPWGWGAPGIGWGRWGRCR